MDVYLVGYLSQFWKGSAQGQDRVYISSCVGVWTGYGNDMANGLGSVWLLSLTLGSRIIDR